MKRLLMHAPAVWTLQREHNLHIADTWSDLLRMQELKDLMKRLLVHAPAQRLGMGKGGAGDLKAHPWFHNFDWEAFQKRQLPAPYIPKVLMPGWPLLDTCYASRFFRPRR